MELPKIPFLSKQPKPEVRTVPDLGTELKAKEIFRAKVLGIVECQVVPMNEPPIEGLPLKEMLVYFRTNYFTGGDEIRTYFFHLPQVIENLSQQELEVAGISTKLQATPGQVSHTAVLLQRNAPIALVGSVYEVPNQQKPSE